MTQLQPEWLKSESVQTLLDAFDPDTIRFVGGCVRDALLGVVSKDIDLATILHPEDTISALEAAGLRAIPTGMAHGTVTALVGKDTFEITTLRKDEECDGRRAAIRYSQSWEEDAQRRDFTMNALYMGADGTLYDTVDGTQDAKAGVVRFIGDANARIEEDYLRILRFFRFYARFAQGAPDTRALQACVAHQEQLETLSGERITQELFGLLSTQNYQDTVMLMHTHGILGEALGFKLGDIAEVMARANSEAAPETIIALWLIVSIAKARREMVCEKLAHWLALSNRSTARMELIIDRIDAPLETTAQQKALLRRLGKDDFTELLRAKAMLHNEDQKAAFDLAESWEIPIFPVGGRDLLSLGFPPGKRVGDVLAQLEKSWESGDYTIDKDALIAQAHSLL